ncbi:unnamed protein product [Sphagnum troendelagicum]
MHTFCVASGEPGGPRRRSLAEESTNPRPGAHQFPDVQMLGNTLNVNGEVSERDDKYFSSIGNNAISVYETDNGSTG